MIYHLPQVLEAVAVGLPDAQWGERVVAVVVLRLGAALALDELQRFCRGRLGGFKRPASSCCARRCRGCRRARCSSGSCAQS